MSAIDLGLSSQMDATEYDRLSGFRTMINSVVPPIEIGRLRGLLKKHSIQMDELMDLVTDISEALSGLPD